MERLKGPEINVARAAIERAFREDETAASSVVSYVIANLGNAGLASDPAFTDPYLRMQQIVRSGWYRTAAVGDSILEAARGFASAAEIDRVQKLYDFWNRSPQQFIDKLKAELTLSGADFTRGEEGGSHHEGDPFPGATP